MIDYVELDQRLRRLEATLERLAARENSGTNGTVTSVALSASPSSVFDVSGSPVTGSGTLALSMDNQNANLVLAGPSSGGAATPAFRALADADIAITSTRIPYGDGSNKLTSEAALAYIAADNELRADRMRIIEQATPTTPASGFSLIFAGSSGDNNGVASSVDDAGTVYQMVRYATGTFTPTYFGSVTAGTTTYSSQVGTYTRIGDRVDIAIHLSWSAATGTGNALLGGLPFTARNVTNLFGVPSLLYSGITYAAGNGIQMLIRANTTQIELYNAPASNTGVAAIAVEAGGELLLTATYWI